MIQGCQKSEMHRMTPEWPQALIGQKYPVYTEYSPPRPKFHSVSFYDQALLRYKLVKNWQCTEWPQKDLDMLSVKSNLPTQNIRPRGPNFTTFHSTVSRFSRYKVVENRKCTEWPRITWTTQVSKGPCIHWIPTPEAQISHHFALRRAVFEIQGCRKSEMYQMTP